MPLRRRLHAAAPGRAAALMASATSPVLLNDVCVCRRDRAAVRSRRRHVSAACCTKQRQDAAAAAAAAAVEPLTSLDARLNDFNIAAEPGAGVETQKPRSQHIN